MREWVSAENHAAFEWFVALIAAHGYRGQFWGQTWIYLDIDECTY